MKKTKEIQVQKKETVTEDILCNKCGGSCCPEKPYPEFNDYYGLIENVVHGGYLSSHLQDMTSYRFSLCEGCLKALFQEFKIPVEVKTSYTEDFIPENEIPAALEKHNEDMAEYEKSLMERRKETKS